MKFLKSLIALLITLQSISCDGNKSNSSTEFKDGVYCSNVIYRNLKTTFTNQYNLNIEIKENKIVKIFFKNGFLDESHFNPIDVSNADIVITTFDGKIFVVSKIGESACNGSTTQIDLEASANTMNYITKDEYVVFVVEGNNTTETEIYIPEEPKLYIPERYESVIPPELSSPKDYDKISKFNSFPFKTGKLEMLSLKRNQISGELDDFSKFQLESKKNSFYFDMKIQNSNFKSVKTIDQVYYKVFSTYNEAEVYLKEVNTINTKEIPGAEGIK